MNVGGRDLHRALKSEELGRAQSSNPSMELALARLLYGRDDEAVALHARPNSFTSSGMQTTDLLALLGFQRSDCSLLRPECYVVEVAAGFDLPGFAKAVGPAFRAVEQADEYLLRCGLFVPRLEGWGFFQGQASEQRRFEHHGGGDGHTAMKVESMKTSEDDVFAYAFSWREGDDGKGWVVHYRPKHPPLSEDVMAAFSMLSLKAYEQCPEFNFEQCWWRFFPRREGDFQAAEGPHRAFDAHAQNFAAGLKQLVVAHQQMRPFGLGLLPRVAPGPRHVAGPVPSSAARPAPPQAAASRAGAPSAASDPRFRYDVAISFAGSQRDIAESLARAVRAAGFEVFSDDYYPEQLWGKDLTVFFDDVFRKQSRFCVMLISKEYAERIWPTRERQSAMARAVEERGQEYILPVQVEAADIPGLLPTIGHVPLGKFSIDEIAEMLKKKLGGK